MRASVAAASKQVAEQSERLQVATAAKRSASDSVGTLKAAAERERKEGTPRRATRTCRPTCTLSTAVVHRAARTRGTRYPLSIPDLNGKINTCIRLLYSADPAAPPFYNAGT